MNLPIELLHLYDTAEYDGAGETELKQLILEPDTLCLQCEAYTYEDAQDSIPLLISATFSKVIAYQITDSTWDYFSEDAEHVQLLSYQRPRGELYISRTPANVDAAFVQCIRALEETRLSDHDSLQVLGFTANSFLSRLEAGFGKFVEGPIVYLQTLATVLQQHGAIPSVLPLDQLQREMYYHEDESYGYQPFDKEKLRVVCFGKNWVLLDGEMVVNASSPA